ncbi:TetR/AcrR family transcriptional regulator [Sphingomonas sp. UYP23]
MERDRLDDITGGSTEHNSSVATPRGKWLTGAAVKRPQITDALTRTFFEEWARVGYSALSLDAVARKAGVGKAALYRRWRSKADMAHDLVAQLGRQLPAILDVGDRGSLEADLKALLLVASLLLRVPLVLRIMPDLYAAVAREPTLAAAMRPADAVWEKKVAALLDRAVERGELKPDLDRRLAVAVLIGPVYWRLVVIGQRFDRPAIKTLARVMAAALAAL